jgi:hypothetical protein
LRGSASLESVGGAEEGSEGMPEVGRATRRGFMESVEGSEGMPEVVGRATSRGITLGLDGAIFLVLVTS